MDKSCDTCIYSGQPVTSAVCGSCGMERNNYMPKLNQNINNWNKVIEYYGVDAQSTIAMEECAELIQAISKCKRYGFHGTYKDNLIEEIADVSIILEQLIEMYNIPENDLFRWKCKKINRIFDKMDKDRSKKTMSYQTQKTIEDCPECADSFEKWVNMDEYKELIE